MRSDVEGAAAETKREAGALREDGGGVERLRSEVGEMASAADVAALSEEVARLKEAEARRTRSESAAAKVPVPSRQQAQAAGRT